jgi:ParB family chromosome partitioning protein
MYTDMAREVMGEIDLDPFSSKTANHHVKAKRYFDIGSDAFKQKWFEDQGRVFMNPPYGRKIIGASIDIFITNLANGSITQAIVLVNNATETRWFHSLLKYADIICFPDSRIAFENDDGKHVSGNTRGQVFFYFGYKLEKFEEVFAKIGVVLIPSNNNTSI